MAVDRGFADQQFIPAFSGEKQLLTVVLRPNIPAWMVAPLQSFLKGTGFKDARDGFLKPCASLEEAATQAGTIAAFIMQLTPPAELQQE